MLRHPHSGKCLAISKDKYALSDAKKTKTILDGGGGDGKRIRNQGPTVDGTSALLLWYHKWATTSKKKCYILY